MNTLVPIQNAQGPLAMRQRLQAGQSLNKNFSEGVRDAFPILSIKGKVFRARVGGQEQALIDPQTQAPVPYLDVVLVNASQYLAKSYYAKGFTDGDMDAPTCWSLDSIRPDPSVVNKVNPVCGTCPMNVFGSRITEGGKAAKACQDARRVAVVMPHQLLNANEAPLVFLLRVPQSSLKNLKNHAEELARYSFEPQGCVTRLAFDYKEAYPKLLFNFVAPLNDPQYAQVFDLAHSSFVEGMLKAPDFDTAASTGPVQDPMTQHTGIGGLAPQVGPVLYPVQPEPGIAANVPSQPFHDMSTQPNLSQPIHASPMPQPAGTVVTHPEPVQLHVVPNNLIDLPDGRRFDTVTKQYVEPPQPKVQMPELDPNVVALPEGKFFNTSTRQYVEGPHLGAKEYVAPEIKPRAKKAVPKKDEALAAAVPPKVEAKPAEPVQQAAPEPAQSSPQAIPEEQPHSNGADTKPTVGAAPQSLENILTSLIPPVN